MIGAVLGIIVGLVLAALATAAVSSWSLIYSVSVATLVVRQSPHSSPALPQASSQPAGPPTSTL